ncbi:hypothetical protein JR316_0002184 [Psilocybe cubensis]|uniref:Uncharacterized protein n=2 Tax=Psilocybe cubensis TaxID=181762 RepID=A0A8H7Y867_PSICU|nr:hypothetical protein JR316_0002184 [Psilocybe cubensis]KAH9485277.1 hypothetical protein JR316_0002184 [Psilocybe cubensis]
MSTKAKATSKALPLADVLRDLAVLRSSGVDIPQMFNLKQSQTVDGISNTAMPVQQSVAASHDFVRVSRAAIKLHDSGKVEVEGSKVEEIRQQYAELLDGLKD